MLITYENVPQAHTICKRFTNVFEQTYTRFLDLQKSEEQAKDYTDQLQITGAADQTKSGDQKVS